MMQKGARKGQGMMMMNQKGVESVAMLIMKRAGNGVEAAKEERGIQIVSPRLTAMLMGREVGRGNGVREVKGGLIVIRSGMRRPEEGQNWRRKREKERKKRQNLRREIAGRRAGESSVMVTRSTVMRMGGDTSGASLAMTGQGLAPPILAAPAWELG